MEFIFWYLDSFIIDLVKVRIALCHRLGRRLMRCCWSDQFLRHGMRVDSESINLLSTRRLDFDLSSVTRKVRFDDV